MTSVKESLYCSRDCLWKLRFNEHIHSKTPNDQLMHFIYMQIFTSITRQSQYCAKVHFAFVLTTELTTIKCVSNQYIRHVVLTKNMDKAFLI